MNPLGTTDVTRIVDGIRRRWWLVAAAAAAGAILGLVWSMSTKPVSYTSSVATPPIQSLDALSATTNVGTQPPLGEVAAAVSSDQTRAALGAAVEGASVSATPAVDKSSIDLVISASTDEVAKRAATAYAQETARLYRDREATILKAAGESVDAGIASLRSEMTSPAPSGSGGEPLVKLAELTVRKEMIVKLSALPPVTPSVSKASSSNSRALSMLTLALLIGVGAAGVIGFHALSDRTLRYRDDVEAVVGADEVLGHVAIPADLEPVRAMLERLASGEGARLVPFGGRSVIAPELAGFASGSPSAPQVLVADLGRDTPAALDLAYRSAAAGGGRVLGVLAVQPEAGLLG